MAEVDFQQHPGLLPGLDEAVRRARVLAIEECLEALREVYARDRVHALYPAYRAALESLIDPT